METLYKKDDKFLGAWLQNFHCPIEDEGGHLFCQEVTLFNMAYHNRFVLSVLVDGNVQKELPNQIVTLPFGSDYGLRLRNKHDVRSLVQVFIDGENVSGGGWIIPPNDKIDVFRPVHKDAAFKFVSLSDVEAQDFGKSDNLDGKKGIVEARFYLEDQSPDQLPFKPTIPRRISWDCTTLGSQSLYQCSSASVPTFNKCIESPHREGCTVEGATTGQNFTTATFTPQSHYVALKVTLRGKECQKQIQGFCTNCGVTRNPGNYCGQCGHKFS